MNSNYPRFKDQPLVDSEPKFWRYSVGLALLILVLIGILGFSELLLDGAPMRPPHMFGLMILAPTLAVAALAVFILWKCANWQIIDKLRMVVLASFLVGTCVLLWGFFTSGSPFALLILLPVCVFGSLLLSLCLMLLGFPVWLWAARDRRPMSAPLVMTKAAESGFSSVSHKKRKASLNSVEPEPDSLEIKA
ncbi:MAG TPA: hypothetical protein VK171_05605 [Fimbriimonas sp.]|nr:hypothetical protein [Fimbriimonas sp.]